MVLPSNQVTTLESQQIHMIQVLFGQTHGGACQAGCSDSQGLDFRTTLFCLFLADPENERIDGISGETLADLTSVAIVGFGIGSIVCGISSATSAIEVAIGVLTIAVGLLGTLTELHKQNQLTRRAKRPEVSQHCLSFGP